MCSFLQGFLGVRGHRDGSEFEFPGHPTLPERVSTPRVTDISKGDCLFGGVWDLVVSLVGGFLEPVCEGGREGV